MRTLAKIRIFSPFSWAHAVAYTLEIVDLICPRPFVRRRNIIDSSKTVTSYLWSLFQRSENMTFKVSQMSIQ